VQTEFWWENVKERDHLYDLVIAGSVKLRSVLWKYNGVTRTGFICLMSGRKMGSCEQSN